jgi:uncharacterized membrane protein SirB2
MMLQKATVHDTVAFTGQVRWLTIEFLRVLLGFCCGLVTFGGKRTANIQRKRSDCLVYSAA